MSTIAAPTPVQADERVITDGADSASPLDVEKVRQGHYFRYVLYRVTSFEGWNAKALIGGSLVFSFNTDSDSAIERRGVVKYDGGGGGQLRMPIFNGKGERTGGGVTRLVGGRAVEVWIQRSDLGSPRTYRMSLKVTTTASSECAETCTDRVPNGGMIFHRLHVPCSDREPTIAGTKGNDVLRGTKRNDVIAGRGGNDEITNLHGSDVVCGGSGDDTIDGGRGGDLVLRGGPGRDHIQAGGTRPRPCEDNTSHSDFDCAWPEAVLWGGGGSDVLVGGRHHETLLGGPGRDLLRGRREGDHLDGGTGFDVLRGGAGSDTCKKGEVLHSC